MGYSVFDAAGSVSSIRTQAGVYELSGSTGMYGALVTFTDGFMGSIVWDSGQANNTVASEDVYAPSTVDARLAVSSSIIARGTVIGGSTAGSVRTDITAASGFYTGYMLRITDAASGSGVRFIDDYSSTSGTFNLDLMFPFVPSSGSVAMVLTQFDQNYGSVG